MADIQSIYSVEFHVVPYYYNILRNEPNQLQSNYCFLAGIICHYNQYQHRFAK